MKRALSLLLVVIMSLSMLVGCGGSGDDIPEGTVTLKLGIPQRSTVSSYAKNGFTDYLEEKANVEIDFVFFSSTKSEYVQQVALMCGANQELPDVFLGFDFGHYVMNQYGEDGYFLDLTDLIEEYAPNYKEKIEYLKEEDTEIGEYVQEKGKNTNGDALYGMPRVLCTATDDRQTDAWINKVWLDKLGLQMPTTIEELRNVLYAFKTQDPNGNGEADELPMIGRDFIPYIINAFVNYEGEYNVTDGKVWDPVKTDEFRQAMIYGNELVKDELYSSLTFTVTNNTELKTLISPADGPTKVGVFAGYPTNLTNPSTNHISEFAALPPLKDATGRGGYTMISERHIQWTGFITKDCEYPAVAMKFLDLFYEDETITRQRHGVKDKDWEYVEGTSTVGEPAYTRVLNELAYTEGDSTWCGNMLGIMTHWNYLSVSDNAATERIAESHRLSGEAWEIIKNANEPKERCNYLVYTQEEYELREEKAGLMNTYVNEEMTKFVSGVTNPKDDAQWNEFLTNLDSLGRVELMEVAQNAYSRK